MTHKDARDRNGAMIWDIPVRLFHWLFAGGFIAAAILSLVLGDDSPLFPYHAIIGFMLVLLIILRVIWGIVGTRYARFSAFAYSPRSLVVYLGSAVIGKSRRYVGANPGSAYAALAMMLIVIGLAITGVMLGQGNESVKDFHEILAYAMLVIVAAHLAGIVVHNVRHRENIAASMVHGLQNVDPRLAIRSPRPLAGIAFMLVSAAGAIWLMNSYQAATQTMHLPLISTALQLGDEHDDHHDRSRSTDHQPKHQEIADD